MKILFVISVHGHGRGGHFHSLNHISRELAPRNQVEIVSLGPGRSSVLEGNPYFTKNIYFNGFNFWNVYLYIKNKIRNEGFEIIHFFDEGSFNSFKSFINHKKVKTVVSKCGGPNPTNYPFVNNLILFSRENLEWFNSYSKYEKTNISLIPNRVKEVNLIENPGLNKPSDAFVFLRICRIGSSYEKSLLDSINLVRKLQDRGLFKIKLYVIGYVENIDIFHSLQKKAKGLNVLFLVDDEYTVEASRYLNLADAVIGTGRGLMEACSVGKPVLVIDSTGNLPILIDENNFLAAFKTNFSQRGVFDEPVKKKNLDKIERLICDEKEYKKASVYSRGVFEHYFDLKKVEERYSQFYKFAKKEKINFNFPFFIEVLGSSYRFLRSSIKKSYDS